jgi:hypothetical protein
VKDAFAYMLNNITPEQRQKMVDAYHSYMKKHKKNTKK